MEPKGTKDKREGMSRREALKRMGMAVVGAAVASSGVFSLTSCARKKKRVILYFTGTGNCLYVARELAKAGLDTGRGRKVQDISTELLSIPQLVKQNRFEIEADEIGLVYPIYGHMPPYMVRCFIQRARLKADYKFAVLTYGSRKCSAVEIWDGISRKAGNPFDYINTLAMVDNWLPNFDMNEQMRIDKHIPENLQKISADIVAQKRWHEPVTEEERRQHQGFIERSGLDPEVGFLMRSEKYFEVNDACVGCGVCVAVCPRGNYEMGSRGILIQGDCEFCFACIQNCPQKAIQFVKNESDPLLGRGEKNPAARYRNENVSLMDIKRANSRF